MSFICGYFAANNILSIYKIKDMLYLKPHLFLAANSSSGPFSFRVMVPLQSNYAAVSVSTSTIFNGGEVIKCYAIDFTSAGSSNIHVYVNDFSFSKDSLTPEDFLQVVVKVDGTEQGSFKTYLPNYYNGGISDKAPCVFIASNNVGSYDFSCLINVYNNYTEGAINYSYAAGQNTNIEVTIDTCTCSSTLPLYFYRQIDINENYDAVTESLEGATTEGDQINRQKDLGGMQSPHLPVYVQDKLFAAHNYHKSMQRR